MKTYNVCWSGGLDSTLVVTQLTQFPVIIRPFYIKGLTYRLSEPQELDAIAAIAELLLADPRTKAKLLPLTIIENGDQRAKDREIIRAHRRIYTHLLEDYKAQHGGVLPPAGSQQVYVDSAFVSPQYVACASLAKYLGETIELGVICDDLEHVFASRSFFTSTASDELTGRKIMFLREDTPDKDLYTLFRDIQFPLAGQQMYKRDIWQWYSQHQYTQVRSKTISCQDPVLHADGTWEPCGVCTACIGLIHEHLQEPFTEAGLARYRDYEKNHEKEPERFRLKGF